MNVVVDEERVLILAPIGRDGALAASLLAKARVPSQVCRHMGELADCIRQGAGCILVTEETLHGAAVATLRATLADQPPWSDLPLLVFSSAPATRAQTVELERTLGNVTILDRPVHVRTMLTAVETALRGRRRQYAARQEILQRDQFLAMLGHELRNPLSAITFAAELMSRDVDTAARERQRSIVERQARHLSRLVDDLLDVSRVTSGKVVLQRQPVELKGVAERCVQVVDVMARAKSQSLTMSLPTAAVIVDGDAVRLEQIVMNVLTNAVKYTPRGGRIELDLSFADRVATLRVRDTGVGIPATMIDKIFELFAQAPSSLDRSEGGLGLGLTLVRSLVTLHGGTVEAKSEGADRGSELIICLPARSQPSLVPSVSSPAAHADASPLRILVVDDNDDVRDTLQALLETGGHVVEAAPDGAHGLSRILTSRPDVAIVDIGLPGIDGYEVARQVRRALGPAVTLIALSGYGQPEDRARARQAGFDLHIAKPIAADALFELLRGRGVAGSRG
jgi:signal transduction histidine kinase/ActR/RegA family two-component response regulator